MSVLCAGSWVADLVASHLPGVPPPGGLVYAPRGIDLRVGGHSANVAVDLVQLGAVGVSSAGCVGEDALGRFLEDSLRGAGVEPLPLRLPGFSTAKNLALVVEGEDRRFIAELAANTELTPLHVEECVRRVEPRVFYLGTVGGLRRVDPELTRVLRAARGAGALTVVDVIAPTAGWSHLAPALPLIDVLHCNGQEAAGATGQPSPGRAARWFASAGVGVCVVSLGARGLVASDGAGLLEVPAFRVEEVDPTGAGDALCAGIILSLLRAGVRRAPSLDGLLAALVEGSAAGAACVTATGATTAVTLGIVGRLLAEQRGEVEAGVRVTRQSP